MSFMLVVMFFAVFGLIVLTEIFLIDERRGVSIGGTGVLGGHRSGHRLPAAPDRPDYGEVGVNIRKRGAIPRYLDDSRNFVPANSAMRQFPINSHPRVYMIL